LSNLYLHYVLDLWFERRFRQQCRGEAYFFRYADDFVACFQYREDAERFLSEMAARLEEFHLEVEASKTRLLRFGRFARQDAEREGREREARRVIRLQALNDEPDTCSFTLTPQAAPAAIPQVGQEIRIAWTPGGPPLFHGYIVTAQSDWRANNLQPPWVAIQTKPARSWKIALTVFCARSSSALTRCT